MNFWLFFCEYDKIKMFMIDNIEEKESYKLYLDTLEIKLELFLMLKERFPEYII